MVRRPITPGCNSNRSEEHTSELQSLTNLVCRLLLHKNHVLKDDPRPPFLGEYFFPTCHEQADVAIAAGVGERCRFGRVKPDAVLARVFFLNDTKPPEKSPLFLRGALPI